MRKVYSCNSIIELAPYKFALAAEDIKLLIKNEFAQGAIGELPPTDALPQIWVLNDSDFEQAQQICIEVEKQQQQLSDDWLCVHCSETNASSFEYCWQCQTIRPPNND